jgi:hypothetical protein
MASERARRRCLEQVDALTRRHAPDTLPMLTAARAHERRDPGLRFRDVLGPTAELP